MILRPDAVVLPSGLETGLEICFADGAIDAIRPWTSSVRNESGFVLSPKFVNAHSHLEYFDLMGEIASADFWQWLGALTSRKHQRDPLAVAESIRTAAKLNVATGVWAIAEWCDWPGSDAAMSEFDLKGPLFQEVITFREWDSPSEKLDAVRRKAAENANRTYVTPHSPYTVAPAVIAEIAAYGEPLSIHAAESQAEESLFRNGTGPIADAYTTAGIGFEPFGTSAVGHLDALGALHPNTQLVHLCTATNEDLEVIASRGCSVAHCPRSNAALGCPVAQIGMMLDREIPVGLGLDSAASSGPIDMFAEMRSALDCSLQSERPLRADEVWNMAIATNSVPGLATNEVVVGASPRVMLIEALPDFADLISKSPKHVRDVVL